MKNTDIIEEFPINNIPTGDGLYRGIAGNFDTCAQAIFEPVDNAISNYRKNKNVPYVSNQIFVTLEDCDDYAVITVEDGGTGIADIHSALTVGGEVHADTPLNEHQFGLKHYLASMERFEDQDWTIRTRTAADADQNRFLEVHSPYVIDGMRAAYRTGNGGLSNSTGTMIRVRCSETFFETLKPAKNRAKATFEDKVEFLAQELSYTYAPLLASGEIEIHLTAVKGGKVDKRILAPMEPEWETVTPVTTPVIRKNLGGGSVCISCSYGEIVPEKKNFVYYKGNMEASGVEIRINGRAIEHGLFSRIFGKAIHNSQNRLLIQVELESEDAAALPATKTAKNGFRDDDPKLEALFAWIRANVPIKDDRETKEQKLVSALEDAISKRPDTLRTDREMHTYCSIGIGVKMDLFVSRTDKVMIYEAKVDSTKCLDVYQLRMYWDGCAMDGTPLDEAVLIAARHPAEVKALIEQMNHLTDPTGRRYRFRAETWREEGINYPAA